jgi:catechol 2,3-dioxygenase-like lactoylglutathione lyase family enzyme
MDVLSSRILLRPGDLDRSRRFYRDLLGLIDWQFFFLAWELKGKYPAILVEVPADHPLRRDPRPALPLCLFRSAPCSEPEAAAR